MFGQTKIGRGWLMVVLSAGLCLATAVQQAVALDGPLGDVGALLDTDASRIGFQGVFANAGGQPLPGNSVNLEFAIYAVGNPVAIEVIPQAAYPMVDGVVQTQIPVSPDSFDGTGRELGVTVNDDPEMTPHIPLTAAAYAMRVNRVASPELDDDIWLGDEDSAGSLSLFNGFHDSPSITADGLNSVITLFDTAGITPRPGVELDGRSQIVRVIGNDGLDDARLFSGSFGPTSRGQLSLYDAGAGNERTVRLTANVDSGGQLELSDTDAHLRIDLSTSTSGGLAELYDASDMTVQVDGQAGAVRADGSFELVGALPGSAIRAALQKGGWGGVLNTWDTNGQLTTSVGSSNYPGVGGGGVVAVPGPFGGVGMFQTVGGETGVLCDGDNGHYAGLIRIQNENGSGADVAFELNGDAGDDAPLFTMNDKGQTRVLIDAKESDWDPGLPGGGAVLTMYNRANKKTIEIDADENGASASNPISIPGAGEMQILEADGEGGLLLDGDDGNGARITLGENNTELIRINADDGDGGGRMSFYEGKPRDPNPDPNTNPNTDPESGQLEEVIVLNANDANGSSRIELRNDNYTNVLLDSCGGDDQAPCGGGINIYDGVGHATIQLDADEVGTSQTGAVVRIGTQQGSSGHLRMYRNGVNGSTIYLNGDQGAAYLGRHASIAGATDGQSGEFYMYANDETEDTIFFNGHTGNGRFGKGGVESGELFLYADSQNSSTIHLNGHTGNGSFKSVTITGGADLAEPFDVSNDDTQTIEAGMVVSIDPANPGHLKLSDTAYDRTVAGVISGAGGVSPGMVMSQNGTMAFGKRPVALTGRVYVWADATDAPIAVGDMLTTSSTAGHAAKVVDHSRAQGAIIGKAMTPLADGRGLVLVLVSLQ